MSRRPAMSTRYRGERAPIDVSRFGSYGAELVRAAMEVRIAELEREAKVARRAGYEQRMVECASQGCEWCMSRAEHEQ